jgi:hypothetical protein
VNSPEWWADRLSKKLSARQSKLERLERYYDGKQPLSFATSQFRAEFGSMLAAVQDNWCQLVVSAVEERLDVEGFRVGDDDQADAQAWNLWQANGLDADSQVAHTEALKLSEAHVIVWRPDLDAPPVITVEHPKYVTVELDPENRSRRLAAAKVWRDPDDGRLCTVYLPDRIVKLRAGQRGWEPRPSAGDQWQIDNPLGVVPVVPLFNRPGLLTEAASEIESILPKQDMVNKLIADMMIAAEYGAFRQRWATGIEVPKDPITGEDLEDFQTAVDRLWHVPAPDAKFGEFEQTDLNVYVKAIEMLVQHIASQTATPPHYLLSTGQLPSGESLRAAEAPLVAKARRKQRIFGQAWEEVTRLALRLDGRDDVDQSTVIETIWRDPENRTEAEHIDAVIKQKALDVPIEELWRLAGFSQVEIDRMRRQRVEQLTMLALGQPITAFDGEGVPADEIKTRAEAAQALVAGGMSLDDALHKAGLA